MQWTFFTDLNQIHHPNLQMRISSTTIKLLIIIQKVQRHIYLPLVFFFFNFKQN